VDDSVSQRILRHSTVATTQNHYVKTASPDAIAAMRQFSEALKCSTCAPEVDFGGSWTIQLTKLRQFLGEAATSLAPGFGGGDSGRVFALATILSYVLLGFLVGYLWTRLYFAGALRAADVAALAREIKEIRDQHDLVRLLHLSRCGKHS
jgi:hypothetical protein